jgi:hypothetical protein
VYRSGLLVAAALLAIGCGDTAGPERTGPDPGTPAYAVAPPTPIAFDQQNSKLGEFGTAIWQGFHPTNPHVGDAIIVTFFWPGSTNIVTSVIDYLVDGTPVGNTYTLVEYVTAGGISMATYVATNVQNFPDPNPDQDKVLVVQANLSSPIPDGGAIMSAYTGVNTVSAWAVGAHQSASGSGSSITTAAPGAIAVGAGALAYGITLADGEVGVDPPEGFTYITNISDPSLKADGRYAVQGSSVGSVDPQWIWYFDSPPPDAPRTWLATVLALNPPLHFVFTVQPSTTLPFLPITPDVKVTAVDALGNAVSSFTGSVTIRIGKNGGTLMAGQLSGTTTVAAVNGVATFSNLSIDQLGNGYRLEVIASGLTGAESRPFNIGAW